MHPSQQPGLLERGDRDADAVATALRGPGDSLVAWEASPATIGAVKPLQQRLEHVQGGASERAPMLAGLAIRAVVGRRSGPHTGFGVAVEAMRGCRAENLFAPWPQMTRQNKLHAGSIARARHRPSLSAEILRLTAGRNFGEPRRCHTDEVSRFDRYARPALGGLLLFLGCGAPEG